MVLSSLNSMMLSSFVHSSMWCGRVGYGLIKGSNPIVIIELFFNHVICSARTRINNEK